MVSTEAVFVGIDPTAGARPLNYAALDGDLRLVATGSGTLEEVLAFVGGLEQAVVAVGAPQSHNRGLMLQPEVRRRFHLRPGGKTWGGWKVAEYELRRRNIRLSPTPSREVDAPGWMQTGFRLFKRLSAMGFRHVNLDDEPGPKMMIEVHPNACFTTLLERRPFLKGTLEGRLQRQLVLYREGLDVADPMHALEEITRHHLLSGELPLHGLYTHDELEAMAAAHTAYLVGVKPARVSQVGDRAEGWITLPVPALKNVYA
jgi:hypothetical protein